MKVGLMTWGTRGDIEPFFALSRALGNAGHEVRMAVSTRADAPLPESNARVELVGASMTQEQGNDLFDRIIALSSPMDQAKLVLAEGLLPSADALFEAASEFAEDCDLIVRHHFLFMAQAAAMRAGTPEVSVYLTPDLLPTREHPPTGMPNLGPLNKAAWWAANKGISGIFGAAASTYRERAGLPKSRGVLREDWPSATANLIAVSPALFPRPADWDATSHATGFWRVPSSTDTPIDAALEEFLDAGEAPVYGCFGSMEASSGPRRASDVGLLCEAAEAAGVRLILQVPPGDTVAPRANVHVVHRAPHAVVFPRCSVIIHHGGAGTTQTAMRSGRPSVVVPHIADQFFWGAQVERLGAGVVTKARVKVTPGELASAIARASSRPPDRTLAERLDAEDGAATAASVIDKLL